MLHAPGRSCLQLPSLSACCCRQVHPVPCPHAGVRNEAQIGHAAQLESLGPPRDGSVMREPGIWLPAHVVFPPVDSLLQFIPLERQPWPVIVEVNSLPLREEEWGLCGESERKKISSNNVSSAP